MATKEEKKYELFMEATQLDVVEAHYAVIAEHLQIQTSALSEFDSEFDRVEASRTRE